ncbi:MAG: hypothetical protein JNK79_06420 [Chitinophagaceae bacterium]|nr:hypothetical protein [Chitinophagaceae bacterium]
MKKYAPGDLTHPFKWFVPENATTLIIGTFPPVEKRWGFKFFYPNLQNNFWTILSKIAGTTLSTDKNVMVAERQNILRKLKTGITDMGAVIKRLSPDSKDESLEIVEYMEILHILREHPSLKKIILTSSSGKSSALAWFKGYLEENNIAHVIPKRTKPLQFDIQFKKRTISVHVLYSPSRRAANRISFEKLVEMYKDVILQ